ncbi:MAG: rRNA cytosine-C5-methylase [Magnetococcales bacterium]|nr:rRNA cytosine-C5-methylase [Magnetococcales bacterium]
MRYGGQVQAAIDLYNEAGRRAAPLDIVMSQYFRNRRYIGSKDKGVVAGILYGLMRRMGEVNFLIESVKGDKSYRLQIFVYLLLEGASKQTIENICSGDTYAPKLLNNEEKKVLKALDFGALKNAPDYVKLNYPKWMDWHLKQTFGDKLSDVMEAMNQQATTDIRVNTLVSSVDKVQANLKDEGFEMRRAEYSPLCLRMDERRSVFSTKAFKDGAFEMQDEGSQLIAALCRVKAGLKVTDFCAGAGGKTLALSADMGNKGTICALDINERRLKEMPKRLKRAGVNNVQTHLIASENDKWVKRHKETQDVVLVDAPCSGAGTWRRSPDSRWKLTQESLAELNEIQSSVLQSAARLVKKGGRLVYATCSVLRSENEEQVEKFLEANPSFKLQPIETVEASIQMPEGQKDFLRLNPFEHGTDGFFVACLVKDL